MIVSSWLALGSEADVLRAVDTDDEAAPLAKGAGEGGKRAKKRSSRGGSDCASFTYS